MGPMPGECAPEKHEAGGAELRYRRIVAKFGTNLLTAGTDRLDLEIMASLVGQVARLVRRGARVIIVTSGAVAAGQHRLGNRQGRRGDVAWRQVLASIGQSALMQAYEQLFSWHDLVVGQTLLTRRDLADKRGYLTTRNALEGLLAAGVVPIVNENDVVATDEIAEARIGDNDNLSAYVANLVDADLLAILTNIGGLYTADPNLDPTAILIPRVERIDETVERLAGRVVHARSRGGMATKLQAARLATGSGVDVVIASGHEPQVLARLAQGEAIGTVFPATSPRLVGRRRFYRMAVTPVGRMIVDEGAAQAIAARRSLLPAGIVGVEGEFKRGDVVEIVASDGRRVATGRSRYDADDVRAILGHRSDQIIELLGYSHGDEVVHSDDLALE
jgi:glutamate 5-kinase